MRRRTRNFKIVRKQVSLSVLLGWALVLGLGVASQAQARAVKADKFFQRCPGMITVEKTTEVTGIAKVSGDCTIQVNNDASLQLVDANVTVEGDLIIEGDADQVALRYSRISSVGVIYVSTGGDVMVSNSRFDSAEVSFDAAEMVRVTRSNFKRVDEPITIMGGTSCEVRANRPEDIGCTIDPTPECFCFDAASVVAEVDAFLDAVPGATLNQCERPAIRVVGSQNEALTLGSTQLEVDRNMCSVAAYDYRPQVLEPSSEFNLTEEELGACQLVIERACLELTR